MVNKTLSFLLGVVLSSAWWQAGVFSYGNENKSQWVVASAVTLVSLWVIACNVYEEWLKENRK